MTEGTFIINGAEKVVNQIVRSPGVFQDEQDKNGRRTYNANAFPNKGMVKIRD